MVTVRGENVRSKDCGHGHEARQQRRECRRLAALAALAAILILLQKAEDGAWVGLGPRGTVAFLAAVVGEDVEDARAWLGLGSGLKSGLGSGLGLRLGLGLG